MEGLDAAPADHQHGPRRVLDSASQLVDDALLVRDPLKEHSRVYQRTVGHACVCTVGLRTRQCWRRQPAAYGARAALLSETASRPARLPTPAAALLLHLGPMGVTQVNLALPAAHAWALQF